VKWSDVAGLEGAKDALKEAVILPIRFPQFFVGKRKPWKGILLYGPPGTGKSYLAKAVATEADSTFFSVSSSDLVSKWQGESERLVKQMFEMARESKPSIVFIDEIDSLCTSRSEGESESSRRIKTEFLVQMDGVGSSQGGVLVLGATNVPWELDPAMRRRFEKRVYIALPEASARAFMFKLNVGNTPNNLNDGDFEYLGQNASGYSGSDIAILTRDALMEPLRKCQKAKQFYRTREGKFTPCNDYPNCAQCPMQLSSTDSSSTRVCRSCGAERIGLYDIESAMLQVPDICRADFEKALSKSHSSVAADELEVFEKWTADFGQEG
jgi:vacuolar protein-sorting-associated protein 4